MLIELTGARRLSSSVQSLDRLGRRGDTRDDSKQIIFQSFLQGALVSSFGTGRDVHSLMMSIQHFLCRPRRRPPSKVPWRMVLERLSWHGNSPGSGMSHATLATVIMHKKTEQN